MYMYTGEKTPVNAGGIQMKIIQVKNYQELSKKAAEIIIRKVAENPAITLGLATGRTPEGMYKELVEDYLQNGTSYSGVSTFNLDEYVGLAGDHPNSYRYYMNSMLFHHINIESSNTHVPNGAAVDLVKECENYEELIQERGGIDLQVLGIGRNGHIGFNEPGSSFDSKTHIVKLTASTRQANAKYFSDVSEVPTHAITMGIGTIMRSKEILLLASGPGKKEAVARLLKGEVSNDFPASILNKHPRVTIIADQESLGSPENP